MLLDKWAEQLGEDLTYMVLVTGLECFSLVE